MLKSKKKTKEHKQKVWRVKERSPFTKTRGLLFGLAFAIVGGTILYLSFAQTPSTIPQNVHVTATSPSTVSLAWDASSAAQSGYKIYRDGKQVGTSTQNNFTDTGLNTNQKYSYRVSAYSGSSETTQSQPPIQAKPIDNPPTVSVSSPTNNASVKGTVSLSATASDDVSVSSVQFKVDNSNLGSPITSSPYNATWDSSSANGTRHRITAIATDNAGHQTTSSAVVVSVDNTGPSISISTPKDNQTVSGKFNVVANSTDNVGVAGVQFQLDGNNLISEITKNPYKFSWDTTQAANGSHQLSATSRDAAGNTNTATITVNVSNAGGTSDHNPPSVKITSPKAGTVSGTVDIQATASDDHGVSEVVFSETPNGGTSQTIGTVTSTPYQINWDSTQVNDGSYHIEAVASDAAGNTKSSTVVVKVKNSGTPTQASSAPVVTITAPINNAHLKGSSVDVSATATETGGTIAGVQFKVDGSNLGSQITSSPYNTNWSATDGNHTLSATASDSNGHSTTKTLKFTVDNTPPTVSITKPANSATVSGKKVNLAVSAHDNDGLASVEYTLDGNGQICKPTKSPFSCTWDTTTLSNDSHTITATATDLAGNTKTSDTINVTVNNASSSNSADTTAPSVPKQLKASDVSPSGATLSWQASKDNTGGSGLAGYKIYQDNGMTPLTTTTNTTYQVTGLDNNKTYKFQVTAYDNSNNESHKSNTATVHTNDSAPTVNITAPTNQSYVKGVVALEADAHDDVGVAGLQFNINGHAQGSNLTATPYTVNWDTSGVASKKSGYKITADVSDAAGHKVTSQTVVVSVDNVNPTASIKSPKDKSTVKGKVTINVNANDNIAMGNVMIMVDGVPIGGQIKQSPYELSWNSANYPKGSQHTITAIATDKAGNSVTTTAVTVTSGDNQSCNDSTPPSVPGSVDHGSITTTSIDLNWSPSTDSGCAGLATYAIYRNGTLVGSTHSTNFTDTGLSPGTAYSYTISAIDNAGNQSNKSTALSVSTLGSSTGVPGDVNGDGHVDDIDLSILLTNFGSSGPAGDLNHDGIVDVVDLSILLSNYGK